MTDQERFIIAHHEMGHALAAYVLPHSTAIEELLLDQMIVVMPEVSLEDMFLVLCEKTNM